MAHARRVLKVPVLSGSVGPAPWVAALVIAVAALAVYHNTFAVPFQFDDTASIRDNPTIRSLWRAWWPPTGSGVTVSGRPLLNFTLALNYAVSGTNVWSYHVVNLLIHVLAGCTLFGVVRRTLRQPVFAGRFAHDADWLGLVAALLWTLHPLQTESVTYIVQRAESLVGLCYLLTLWCFIRATEPGAAVRWKWLAFTACLAGMLTKEVMVTAPLMVFCYDRVFLAASWRDAWTQRGRLHLVLAQTWVVLLALVLIVGNRGGTAGFGTMVSPGDYALTQVGVVVHYLRLAFWPSPLVFDYGQFLHTSAADVLPPALLLVPLVAVSLFGLWRGRAWGFCGMFFFAVLAPTSSIVPVASQTMNEHRLYLPLAAVLTLVVISLHGLLGRRGGLVVVAALALGCGLLTVRRNADYATAIGLWEDTVRKRPDSARANATLGSLYEDAGRLPEALALLQRAVELDPLYAEARNNLGNVLVKLGRVDEAIDCFRRSLALQADRPTVLNNLGNALVQAGRIPEGIAQLEAVLRLDPGFDRARFNLANTLAQAGRLAEAVPYYEAYLEHHRDDAEAFSNYGNVLLELGRGAEALDALATALHLSPGSAQMHNNLGAALAQTGRLKEALREFREAVRLDPAFTRARENADRAARQLGGNN